MLRHIIYDIPPEEDMSIIKKKYYKDYYKTDTDTFYLCQNKQEIDELLKKNNETMIWQNKEDLKWMN